jgi:hypothetical protein
MVDPTRVRTLVLFREYLFARSLGCYVDAPGISQSLEQASVRSLVLFLVCFLAHAGLQENQCPVQRDTLVIWLCLTCDILFRSCEEPTCSS